VESPVEVWRSASWAYPSPSALRRSVCGRPTMGRPFMTCPSGGSRSCPVWSKCMPDPERLGPMHDPAGRGLHLSCDAALVNLRLAAAQLGHEAVVRLHSSGQRSSRGARVRPADGPHRVNREERLLLSGTVRSVSTSFMDETVDVSGIQDVAEPGEVPQVLSEL